MNELDFANVISHASLETTLLLWSDSSMRWFFLNGETYKDDIACDFDLYTTKDSFGDNYFSLICSFLLSFCDIVRFWSK